MRLGKGLHLTNEVVGLLPGVRAQWVQPLPELGHAHGDHRYAVHRRIQLRQIPKRLVQGRSGVDSGAGDDLAVHGDVVPGKALHDVDGLPRPPVFQHPAPQLPVCGVDGHIDGGDAQVDDPLDLPLGEVGQGEVIPHEKAEPRVVILEIQALPHPLGHLVHKAENAVVSAGAGPVHEIGLKLQAQVLALLLADMHSAAAAVRLLERQDQPWIIGVKFIVQHVHHRLAVDLQQCLARPDTRPAGGTAGIYSSDHSPAHPSASSPGGAVPAPPPSYMVSFIVQ